MSIKKNIGWTQMTCNPIRGICKGGCWYCYGKKYYVRFHSCKAGFEGTARIINDEVRLHLSAFDSLPKKASKKIFLCSTHDMFGGWIPKRWRDRIFDLIKVFPQHTFQILTKFPENIDIEMPPNCWLGTSITRKKEMAPRIKALYKAKARIKFISFEPLLEDIGDFRFQGWLDGEIGWLIVGRLTGHGKKYDPTYEQIDKINRYSRHFNIPIFMKENLKGIWPFKLTQEFPRIS